MKARQQEARTTKAVPTSAVPAVRTGALCARPAVRPSAPRTAKPSPPAPLPGGEGRTSVGEVASGRAGVPVILPTSPHSGAGLAGSWSLDPVAHCRAAGSRQPAPATLNREPETRRPRRGFSLPELLGLIAIISLLSGLAFVVVGDALGASKRQATAATVKKVDELLVTRMDAFNRWFSIQGDSNVLLAGNERGMAGGNQDLALVLGRKEYFRRYFPQLFSESTTGISGGPTHNPDTESSECLYFFLTNADAFGAEPRGARSDRDHRRLGEAAPLLPLAHPSAETGDC